MTTNIDNSQVIIDASKELMERHMITLAAANVPKVLKSFIAGVSKVLGTSKDIEKPKAAVLRSIDGKFIVGAIVEYHKNPDDPDNSAAGNWSYSWTFYEDDVKDADIITIDSGAIFNYFQTAGNKLFRMAFKDPSIGITCFQVIMDGIKHWLEDNAKDGETATLQMPGVFVASSEVVDGVVEKSIVPDGEMKTLIKDDDIIQEAV